MPKNYYIDNAEFEKIIKAYQIDPKNNEDRLVEIFDTLISNILLSFNFVVETDDAKQECF